MITPIETLLGAYDRGRLTRRQLCQALLLMATPAAAAAQTTGVLHGRNLHHINLQVTNVPRSEAFYRRLFGLGPSRVVQGPDNHGLDLPGGGILILQTSTNPGRIDHFCIGVEKFEAERMRNDVRSAGFEGVQGTASDNFFVKDPDGLRVQISAVDWPA